MRNEYLRNLGYLKRKAAGFILDYLKDWDRKTSSRVTHFVANSRNVQERIKQAYNRHSIVIYPPVDCDRFTVCDTDDGYYLVVSALVPYKRVDLAVQTFDSLNQKLLIVGDGPELRRLKRIASANVSFVEYAADHEVAEYMKKCTALIFPGEEDFGIVSLEAQACGKPVIAYGKGGALETIKDWNVCTSKNNATGIFFYEQNPWALREAILQFERIKHQFDVTDCRNNALRFERRIYQQSMQDYIQSVMAESSHKH